MVVDPDGFYVDGTFGRGGHTAELLSRLSVKGSVIAIDKDLGTLQVIHVLQMMIDFLWACTFADLADIVEQAGMQGNVSGVLLDLGVSSPQLDQADRGFSFEMALLICVWTPVESSAAEWIASADEQEIAKVFKEYGEEKFARRMAAAIVRQRTESPIERTVQLAKILAEAHPAWGAANIRDEAFQAIRIFINRELTDLEDLPSK